jgi:hypothetical protein
MTGLTNSSSAMYKMKQFWGLARKQREEPDNNKLKTGRK